MVDASWSENVAVRSMTQVLVFLGLILSFNQKIKIPLMTNHQREKLSKVV